MLVSFFGPLKHMGKILMIINILVIEPKYYLGT